MSFKDKVVLITGGGSGIGAATAELFAKEQANLVIVDQNEDALKTVAEKLKNHGADVFTVTADVTIDEELKNILDKTIEKFGKLDVLVNNAGVLVMGSILDEKFMDEFDKAMNTNLRPVVLLTNLAAPYLVKTKGNIVNVSSMAASSILRQPDFLAYGASKAAVRHFTRGAALGLSSVGIRVNSVSPGLTKTNIFNAAEFLSLEELTTSINADRLLEPEEIGELIIFLAGDKAKAINGADYLIDNGCLARN